MRVLCDICGKIAVVKQDERIDGWMTVYTGNGDRFKVCDECIDTFYDFFDAERPIDEEPEIETPEGGEEQNPPEVDDGGVSGDNEDEEASG